MKNTKVDLFRCYRDPIIPPKARNAFMMGDKADQVPGTAELTPIGVLVKTKSYGDYLVPYANVESIKMAPETTVSEENVDESTGEIIKRRPGRPKVT